MEAHPARKINPEERPRSDDGPRTQMESARGSDGIQERQEDWDANQAVKGCEDLPGGA